MCLTALATVSCHRQAAPIERVAILPANLLVSDPASEWLKLGVPLVLQHDLRTAHTLIPGIAPDEATAQQNAATRVLRTSVESRGSGLHAECTLSDAASHKVLRVESAEAASMTNLLSALDQIAKKMDPAALAFPTSNVACWQAFTTAEGGNNPQQRAQLLNQVIRQDPQFGPGWVALLEMIVPRTRNNELAHMLDEAKSHRAGFAAYDRARFDVAMNRIAGASPPDQVKSAQAVAALAPNDLDVLTILGNNQILNGDGVAGEQTLRKAVAINPTNVGLRIQLARGLMELKKFKDSEAMFASVGKAPAVYPELATCLLLQGDTARADSTFAQFVQSLQNDELKPLLKAGWLAVSGDRKQALALLLKANFKTPNIHTIAYSEATVWQAMNGNYEEAVKTAGLLSQTADQAVRVPMIAALIADKTSASADWEKKVQLTGLPDSVKQPLLAYGFFLRGNYDDAARSWQQINDASHGADLRARAMLASSLQRAGKAAASKIAVMPFVPEFADLYAAVSFTEMRRMLGKG